MITFHTQCEHSMGAEERTLVQRRTDIGGEKDGHSWRRTDVGGGCEYSTFHAQLAITRSVTALPLLQLCMQPLALVEHHQLSPSNLLLVQEPQPAHDPGTVNQNGRVAVPVVIVVHTPHVSAPSLGQHRLGREGGGGAFGAAAEP